MLCCMHVYIEEGGYIGCLARNDASVPRLICAYNTSYILWLHFVFCVYHIEIRLLSWAPRSSCLLACV